MKQLTLIFILLFTLTLTCFGNTIEIPRGASTQMIAQILKESKLIKSKTMFRLYIKLKGLDGKLRAGHYHIDPSYSYGRISRILQEKEGASSLQTVTIPEGFSLSEIAAALKKAGILTDPTAFIDYVQTKGRAALIHRFDFLEAVPTTNLEGYLFPDTYVFAKGVSYNTLLAGFLSEFETQLYPLWQKSKTAMSLHDAVTFASIVEREAQVEAEIRTISGVFHNRIKKRIPLGSCPTVGYALGDPRKKIITFEDVKIKSPYNTYIHLGLPPTPIASPGVTAFQATLQPEKTPYLYFVANGDGTHVFSTTYQSHLKSQRQILRSVGK